MKRTFSFIITLALLFVTLSSVAYADITGKTKVQYLVNSNPSGTPRTLLESSVGASTLEALVDAAQLVKNIADTIKAIADGNPVGAVAGAVGIYDESMQLYDALADKTAYDFTYINLNQTEQYDGVILTFEGRSGTHWTDDTFGSIRSSAPVDPEHFFRPDPTGIGTITVDAEVTIRNIQSLRPGVYPVVFTCKEEDCGTCLSIIHVVYVHVECRTTLNAEIQDCVDFSQQVGDVSGRLATAKGRLRTFLRVHGNRIRQLQTDLNRAINICRHSVDPDACSNAIEQASYGCIIAGMPIPDPLCPQLQDIYYNPDEGIVPLEDRLYWLQAEMDRYGCWDCPEYPPKYIEASDGISEDEITVTWGEVIGPSAECGYIIYRADSLDGSKEQVGITDPGVTFFYDDWRNALAGKTYYYWVAARDRGGYIGVSCDNAIGSPTYSNDEYDTGWRACYGGIQLYRDPSPPSFYSSGGTGSVEVHTNRRPKERNPDGGFYYYDPDCSWNASTNVPWITITSPVGDTIGDGTVEYLVAPNPVELFRRGTLTIGREEVTIRQSGASPVRCRLSIDPRSETFDSSGGTGSVIVNDPFDCGWLAESNDSWITITFTDFNTVKYSVAPNTTTLRRRGTITIFQGEKTSTFRITQGPESPVRCRFNIIPKEESFSSSGGNGSVSVTDPFDCGWRAESNESWITITSIGFNAVNYSVSVNKFTWPRNGTITIAGKTFTVNQSSGGCTYGISPTSQSFNFSGGTGRLTVNTQEDCNWTATSNASWITITSGSSGSGKGTVNYSVAPYTAIGGSRLGTLTVAGNVFTVTQYGRIID